MVPRANKNAAPAAVKEANVEALCELVGVPAIYKSLNQVHRQLVSLGISKDQRNKHQGFNFRGIDDVYNVVSTLLAEADIVTPPEFSDHVVTERKTKNDGVAFNTVLKSTYRYTSTLDGSFVPVTVFGEASDAGDKATAKAMAVAHKYAHFQLFNIPIEGRPEDRDPDYTSEEVGERTRPTAAANRAPTRVEKDEPPVGEAPEDTGDQSQAEDESNPVVAHLAKLIPDEAKRKKANDKLLDAYGVMLLEDIAEKLWPEAISKIDAYVAAQKARATAKK